MKIAGAGEQPDDDALAALLRGFGPLGLAALLVILAGNGLVAPLSAILVLAWAWRSRTPWPKLGFVRPRRWAASLLGGLVFGAALKLVLKAAMMPLLGAAPTNAAYQHPIGNSAALPGMLFAVIVSASFGEETLFRSCLFERLSRLLNPRGGARVAIVLLTSLWFGLAHFPEQGLAGAQQALIVGLALGTVSTLTGEIWIGMAAHAAFDLVALAMIYWDLEAAVAGLLFPLP